MYTNSYFGDIDTIVRAINSKRCHLQHFVKMSFSTNETLTLNGLDPVEIIIVPTIIFSDLKYMKFNIKITSPRET